MVMAPSPSLTELSNNAFLCCSEFSIGGASKPIGGSCKEDLSTKECCLEDLEVPPSCRLSHISRHRWAESSPSLSPVPAPSMGTVTPEQRPQAATGSYPLSLETLLNSVHSQPRNKHVHFIIF